MGMANPAMANPEIANVVYQSNGARKMGLARAPSVVATVADGECTKFDGPGPAPFDYERAACWAVNQPACAGKQQSPINIVPSTVKETGTEKLVIKHYPPEKGGKAI